MLKEPGSFPTGDFESGATTFRFTYTRNMTPNENNVFESRSPKHLALKKHKGAFIIVLQRGKAIKSSQISHRKLLVTPGRFH